MQGRQTQSYTGNFAKGKAIRPGFVKNTGNVTANQPRIIRCYNCRAQAQEVGVALDQEQLAFLVDTEERVNSGPHAQALATTDIFQTYDLDAFDSDCDDDHKQVHSSWKISFLMIQMFSLRYKIRKLIKTLM
ncbi:hypothetical protein Tco_1297640 [Tanacetum coccineum]